MAFWNKKKGSSRLINYFTEKGIACEMVEGKQDMVTFTLVFKNCNFMIHPYITLTDQLISMDVNIVQTNSKSYDLMKLNKFNMNSKFFKAFITEEGIVTLEYKFLENNMEDILNNLLDSLYNLEEEIDFL